MNTRLILLLLLCGALQAEVLDRIAVTVGKRVITQSDIVGDIRLSSFLNGSEPDLTPGSRRRAAERLVERALAEAEMEIGKYPAPDPDEAGAQLDDLRRERFAVPSSLEQALAGAGLTVTELRHYLGEQIALLRFIDARFGPAVLITDEELQAHYSGPFTKEWESSSKQPPPPFEEARAEIEEELRAGRIDGLLDQWLRETRERTRIVYISGAFE